MKHACPILAADRRHNRCVTYVISEPKLDRGRLGWFVGLAAAARPDSPPPMRASTAVVWSDLSSHFRSFKFSFDFVSLFLEDGAVTTQLERPCKLWWVGDALCFAAVLGPKGCWKEASRLCVALVSALVPAPPWTSQV